MNRRNVLVGLGVIVVMSGVLLGTGAFSTVEADRTVSVSTTGDGSALLGLAINESYNGLSDGSGTNEDAIEINTQKLNDNATTTFDDALIIGNNGSQTTNVSIISSPTGLDFTYTDGSGNEINLENGKQVAPGDTLKVSIKVDTNENLGDSETITIKADTV